MNFNCISVDYSYWCIMWHAPLFVIQSSRLCFMIAFLPSFVKAIGYMIRPWSMHQMQHIVTLHTVHWEWQICLTLMDGTQLLSWFRFHHLCCAYSAMQLAYVISNTCNLLILMSLVYPYQWSTALETSTLIIT